jgi:hypothetical protein
MARVFMAARDDERAAMELILGPRHDIVGVTRLDDAIKAYSEHECDLIMIGVHFDDSRMFELLRIFNKTPEFSATPVICFCTQHTPLTRKMHESIELASRVLGAWMYLDEHEFAVSKDPRAELLRIIERCLTSEARKKTQANRHLLQLQRQDLLRLREGLEGEEWSIALEDRVADLRQKLSVILLELSGDLIDSLSQQEQVAESKQLEDRVSKDVQRTEKDLGRDETQLSLDESAQLAKEQLLVPREEAKGKRGRHQTANPRPDSQ